MKLVSEQNKALEEQEQRVMWSREATLVNQLTLFLPQKILSLQNPASPTSLDLSGCNNTMIESKRNYFKIIEFKLQNLWKLISRIRFPKPYSGA